MIKKFSSRETTNHISACLLITAKKKCSHLYRLMLNKTLFSIKRNMENLYSILDQCIYLEIEKYLDKCVTAVRQGNYSFNF